MKRIFLAICFALCLPSVSHALQCIRVYPQGLAPDSGVTAATETVVPATATAAARRETQFSDTGSAYGVYKFFAPSGDWTLSANNNQLRFFFTGTVNDNGPCNLKMTASCTANTATSDPTNWTGHEGTPQSFTLAFIGSSGITAADAGPSSAIAVHDNATTLDCTSTDCQGKQLLCAVTRDNAVGSNCANDFDLTSVSFCY